MSKVALRPLVIDSVTQHSSHADSKVSYKLLPKGSGGDSDTYCSNCQKRVNFNAWNFRGHSRLGYVFPLDLGGSLSVGLNWADILEVGLEAGIRGMMVGKSFIGPYTQASIPWDWASQIYVHGHLQRTFFWVDEGEDPQVFNLTEIGLGYHFVSGRNKSTSLELGFLQDLKCFGGNCSWGEFFAAPSIYVVGDFK